MNKGRERAAEIHRPPAVQGSTTDGRRLTVTEDPPSNSTSEAHPCRPMAGVGWMAADRPRHGGLCRVSSPGRVAAGVGDRQGRELCAHLRRRHGGRCHPSAHPKLAEYLLALSLMVGLVVFVTGSVIRDPHGTANHQPRSGSRECRLPCPASTYQGLAYAPRRRARGTADALGNPDRVGPSLTAQQAVDAYQAWICHPDQAELLDDAREQLVGKTLVCWCSLGHRATPMSSFSWSIRQ
ncbi:MAG: DUF4326 domain-containing protein [Acidimicrobiales bacterium]